MATSRTGTAQWKRVRKQAIAEALEAGQTHCPICGTGLDWEYAGRPNSAEVDHIKPHSQGGTDTIDNTRIICRLDNQRLGGRLNRKTSRPNVQTVHLDTSNIW